MNTVVMVLDLIRTNKFFLSNGEWDENTVIPGVDNSSSVHIDNKKIYLSSW